jgi:Fic family protein
MRSMERPPYVAGKYDFNEVLAEISRSGRLEEISSINEEQYPYWDKWKFRARDWKLDPLKVWYFVKALRLAQVTIPFSNLPGLPLRLNNPSIIQRQLHELDLGLKWAIRSDDLIPMGEEGRFLEDSLMEEAIASSQLEGAMTSRQEARQMLQTNKKPLNHSEQMILNNYKGMRWLVDHKDAEITPDLIRELHFILVQKTLSQKEEERAFRESDDVRVMDVQTGSIVHTPPPFVLLDKLMSEFCRFANDSRKDDPFLHPITKAIILHFLIGYIHPFVDGNGRTARALFYWYLMKNGYWLVEFLSISRVFLLSKAQYARAYQYTEFDLNDLTYFVVYNLKAMDIAFKDMKKYVSKKRRETNDLIAKLDTTHLNERQLALLQEAINEGKQVFAVADVEKRWAISNQTARTDLQGLVVHGFFEQKKMGKKIIFVCREEALSRLR